MDRSKITHQRVAADTALFQCTVIFIYEIPRFGHVAIIVAEICKPMTDNSIPYKLNLIADALMLLLIKSRLFESLNRIKEVLILYFRRI